MNIKPKESLFGRIELIDSSTDSVIARFEGKKYYKDNILSKVGANEENFIETWAGNSYYGRINDNNQSIALAPEVLRQLPSTYKGKNLLAQDIISEAFNEFLTYYNKTLFKTKQYKLSENSILTDIKITKAYADPFDQYNSYMLKIFPPLVENLNELYGSKIADFNTFVEYFIRFLSKFLVSKPFTFSSFIKSEFCSFHSSGMSFEIFDGSYGNDREKYEFILSDPNFLFFSNTLKKFGFLLDKNLPNTVVANINSSYLKSKKEERGIYSNKEYFNNYYTKAYLEDIMLFQHYLFAFYNSYVDFYPILIKKKIVYCDFYYKVLKTEFSREKVNAFLKGKIDENSGVFEIYNDEYWLKFYLLVKSQESSTKVDSKKNRLILKEAKSIYNLFGFDQAIGFIANKFNY